jgi:response regulator of citrate/malate metabolism
VELCQEQYSARDDARKKLAQNLDDLIQLNNFLAEQLGIKLVLELPALRLGQIQVEIANIHTLAQREDENDSEN